MSKDPKVREGQRLRRMRRQREKYSRMLNRLGMRKKAEPLNIRWDKPAESLWSKIKRLFRRKV